MAAFLVAVTKYKTKSNLEMEGPNGLMVCWYSPSLQGQHGGGDAGRLVTSCLLLGSRDR